VSRFTGRMHHFSLCGKQGRVGKGVLDQPQAHQAVIDAGEGRAGELDHVDFDPLASQIVEQRSQQPFGIGVTVDRAIQQVDPHQADRLAFASSVGIVRGDVDDHLRRLGARRRLKPHALPGITGRATRAAVRCGRVGEDEK
jgi:hypothetical protein